MSTLKEKQFTPKQVFSRVGFALLVLILTSVGVQFLLALFSNQLVKYGYYLSSQNWFLWIVTFVPIYCIAMPLCLLMLKRIPKVPFSKTNMSNKNFFLFLLMCFPLMYGGNIIGTLLSFILSGGTATNTLNEFLLSDSLLKIPIVVFIAPFLEEYIFRKQLIDRCSPYGEKNAILLSGISFALYHANLYQFFYAFALGLLFAYVYTRTRKLRYSVIMHMIINFMGSVLAPFVLSMVDLDALTSGNFDLSMLPGFLGYSVYSFSLLALSIAGLVLLIIKIPRLVYEPAPMELEKGTRFKTTYLNIGIILFAVFCIMVSIFNLLFN